jgi:hypothetical protein
MHYALPLVPTADETVTYIVQPAKDITRVRERGLKTRAGILLLTRHRYMIPTDELAGIKRAIDLR